MRGRNLCLRSLIRLLSHCNFGCTLLATKNMYFTANLASWSFNHLYKKSNIRKIVQVQKSKSSKILLASILLLIGRDCNVSSMAPSDGHGCLGKKTRGQKKNSRQFSLSRPQTLWPVLAVRVESAEVICSSCDFNDFPTGRTEDRNND